MTNPSVSSRSTLCFISTEKSFLELGPSQYKSPKQWTPEEDNLLMREIQNLPVQENWKLLHGRTEIACNARLQYLRKFHTLPSKCRRWSPTEDDVLIKNMDILPMPILCSLLPDRTLSACESRLYNLKKLQDERLQGTVSRPMVDSSLNYSLAIS